MSDPDPHGHLFIIDGDLTKLHCDAVLIPTSQAMEITDAWSAFLGVAPGILRDHKRPEGWGSSTRVVRFDGDSTDAAESGRARPPQRWLGAIGRMTDDPTWYATCAVEFVEKVGTSLRTDASAIPPRLAVNVSGSGDGGSQHDKGRLFEHLVPLLSKAARDNGVDVVLVTWGPKQYAAAQRCRQRHVAGRTSDEWRLGSRQGDLELEAKRLAACVRVSELVLFVGAGVSMGAGQPAWKHLIERLAGDAQLDFDALGKLDIRDQASIVARRLGGANAYRSQIAKLIHDDRYALGHGLLASLRVRETVTTNYDRLYETAARTAGRELAVLPYEPVCGQGQWLLKLHGSLEYEDDIVLTRDDYLGLGERAGALFGILQAMLMTRHMLFIGYSLTDDSFHKVMHEVRRAKGSSPDAGQSGTALLLHDDPMLRELWSDQLHLVAVGEAGESSLEAARRLDVFLDLVGHLSADVSSFLLDETYESMLDDGEMRLASAYREFRSAAEAGGAVGAELLRRLGPLGSDS